jgi:hypothetical protein
MEKEKAIKIWKDLGIGKAVMNFNCGGDSMGDTDFEFFDDGHNMFEPKKGQKEDLKYLEDYLDNEVYNAVDFYVNSDGHYQGEFGTVDIFLEKIDNEEEDFTYSKNAQSEWSETLSFNEKVELNDEEVAFIKENVSQIFGNLDENTGFAYNKDLILSDEDLALIESIGDKVYDFCSNYSADEIEGEQEEWFSFNSNCEFEDNDLLITIQISATVIRDSED